MLGLYLVGMTMAVGEEGSTPAWGHALGGSKSKSGSWHASKKASDGLIRPGGRVSRNESYTSESTRRGIDVSEGGAHVGADGAVRLGI